MPLTWMVADCVVGVASWAAATRPKRGDKAVAAANVPMARRVNLGDWRNERNRCSALVVVDIAGSLPLVSATGSVLPAPVPCLRHQSRLRSAWRPAMGESPPETPLFRVG